VVARHNDIPFAGQPLTYTIDYWNYSEAAAHATQLTLTLPLNSVFRDARIGEEPISPTSQAANPLVFALGDSNEGSLDVTVQLAGALQPTALITLTAAISSSELDANSDDNTFEDVDQIASADLVLDLALDTATSIPKAGGEISYILTVSNQGNTAAAPFTLDQTLPEGVSFVRAETGDGQTLTPTVNGRHVIVAGPALEAWSTAVIVVYATIATTTTPGATITSTAVVTAPSVDGDPSSNSAEAATETLLNVPDLWLELGSWGYEEVQQERTYEILYGNLGGMDARDAVLTLTLPPGLTYLNTEGPFPTVKNGQLTWHLGNLTTFSAVDTPLRVTTRVDAAGDLQVRAQIGGTNGDSNLDNNTGQEDLTTSAISAPTITLPITGTVLPTPTFFGEARAGSAVTIYADGVPYATGESDIDSTFVITATQPLADGQHIFTTRAEFGGHTSEIGNPIILTVAHDLSLDPARTTLRGIPIGAVGSGNPPYVHGEQTLQIAIANCRAPQNIELFLEGYDEAGEIVGYTVYTPTAKDDAQRLYTFIVNPDDVGSENVGTVAVYDCDPAEVGATRTSVRARPTGLFCTLFGWLDYAGGGGCNNERPDGPPKPPKKSLKPFRPIDPDGFVYDGELAANRPMTQALITNAVVTLTERTGPSTWVLWNGAAVDGQVNPQHTDATFPDKVLTPGYYSFLVYPGEYRVSAQAPGYAPYESGIIRVIATPVTVHIPMRRLNGNPVALPSDTRIFLPLAQR
jgi:uncharacterized repeat protein (TIGR01451 family)